MSIQTGIYEQITPCKNNSNQGIYEQCECCNTLCDHHTKVDCDEGECGTEVCSTCNNCEKCECYNICTNHTIKFGRHGRLIPLTKEAYNNLPKHILIERMDTIATNSKKPNFVDHLLSMEKALETDSDTLNRSSGIYRQLKNSQTYICSHHSDSTNSFNDHEDCYCDPDDEYLCDNHACSSIRCKDICATCNRCALCECVFSCANHTIESGRLFELIPPNKTDYEFVNRRVLINRILHLQNLEITGINRSKYRTFATDDIVDTVLELERRKN